jgi:branched-chain amino acid transport system ATP-binding protein
MLEVEDLQAAYGSSQVLFGVSLTVAPGEVVALLGRNGMGKTTTVKSIFGLVPARAGRIKYEARALMGLPPYRVAQAGLGLVPEGRQIFPTLTVEENLLAAAANRFGRRDWNRDLVYELFPALAERRGQYGGELSGGEQQMLAIGRALMTNPKLLVLDEATEGLAPLVRAEIWKCLARLKAEQLSILVIDKNIDALVKLADRHVILEKGHVVWAGTSTALAADPVAKERYLSV